MNLVFTLLIFQERIGDYDFVENQDFVCVSQKNETQRADGQIGVSVSNEYFVSVGMAKELSMVERNEKLCGYYLPNHK